ncbi:MAG TPA: hypothetical protein VFA10_08520 [Ktedonobacteraceae bacterium]|nr:hypothetical protein [Ktedonobacteraceae bacterium]
MTIDTLRGSPQFPTITGSIAPSTQDTMDGAIQTLQSHKNAWVRVTVRERITIIDKLLEGVTAIAPGWIAACLQAKGIAEDSSLFGEEWAAGLWLVLKNLRQLRQSLLDIETRGHPHIPGPSTMRPDTGVVHNTLMFERPEKSVLRAPFRSMPMPPWFATRGKTASKLFPDLSSLKCHLHYGRYREFCGRLW